MITTEGKLQLRRRLSKERKAAAELPSPEPPRPRVAPDPPTRAQKPEPRIVFSSLEQRRRESKEHKLKTSLAAGPGLDTPNAKRDRPAPHATAREETFLQLLEGPEKPSSGRSPKQRPGLMKQRRSYYNSAKVNPGSALLKALPAGPAGQPRAPVAARPKPLPTPEASKPLEHNPPSSEQQACLGQKSPALARKQLMVLKVKFDQAAEKQPIAKKPQRTAQDRTRTSTRPKRQSPPRSSAKKKRSTCVEKPAAADRRSTSRRKPASNEKEADRLLSALNLIISSKVDRE